VIRPVAEEDAPELARIYNHYIVESVATFEETPVTAADMGARIAAVSGAGLPWLVSTADKRLTGYAYATAWKPRSAYRFTVESTVYVDPEAVGQGTGTALYKDLLVELRRRRVHAVLAGITLPNPGSIALHEKLGFRKVAELKEVGYKFARWVDVGYWQALPGEIPDCPDTY
jgi:L-amino acid N-acyltransferase YncA